MALPLPIRMSISTCLDGSIATNARFFAVERERVLAPSWQAVCHLNVIPRAGDSHAFEFINESVTSSVDETVSRAPSAMSVCIAAPSWLTASPRRAAASSALTTPGPTTSKAGPSAFPYAKPIPTADFSKASAADRAGSV